MPMFLNQFCRTFVAAALPVLMLSACTLRQPEADAPAADTVTQPATETVVEAAPAEPVATPTDTPDESMAATATPEPTAVVPAYRREDVLWIQTRLQELGYFEGPVDGVAGNKTTSAVCAYQRDQDITADGRPTSQLREFMWRNGG